MDNNFNENNNQDNTGTSAGNASQNNYYYQQSSGSASWQAYQDPYGSEKERRRREKEEKRQARRAEHRRRREAGFNIRASVLVVIIIAALVAGGCFTALGYGMGVNMTKLRLAASGIKTSSQTVKPDTSAGTVVTAPEGVILTDVTDIVESAMPSVVALTSMTKQASYSYDDIYNYFFGGGSLFGGNMFGGGGKQQEEEVASSRGTGIIVGITDTELLVLTSNHVVDGSSSVYATFIDEEAVQGYVKAYDDVEELAIVSYDLKNIKDTTLAAVKVATISTEEARVGEGVVCIGNALGYGQSVTTGIVSATNRTITVEGVTLELIQTNAAINGGNSGGAMLNSRGEVIGVNEAKINSSNVEGMCYAIPVSDKTELLANLMNSDKSDRELIDEKDRGYLGIYGQDVTKSVAEQAGVVEGIYVSDIIEGSGADKAGMVSSDIITHVNGNRVTSMEELKKELAYHTKGEEITLKIYRFNDGKYEKQELSVTLGSNGEIQ